MGKGFEADKKKWENFAKKPVFAQKSRPLKPFPVLAFSPGFVQNDEKCAIFDHFLTNCENAFYKKALRWKAGASHPVPYSFNPKNSAI